MMQHVYKTADMLTFFGFLICKVERKSYYFIFNDLLLNFSQRLGTTRRALARLIDLTLQKVLGRLGFVHNHARWAAISASNFCV